MTSAIDSCYYAAERFCSDDKKLKAKLNKLFAELREKNKTNLEALLPIEHVDMHAKSMDWGELDFEDLEVGGVYRFEHPITENSEELEDHEYQAMLEKVKDEIDTLSISERPLTDTEELLGGRDSVVGLLEKIQDALESADREDYELIWNTAWQPYGDDADIELANRIPNLMGVRYKDDKYITLSSCGQDNGPALMAYVILAHGVVPQQYSRYLTGSDMSWTMHVIGRECLMECADKLGIREAIEARLDAEAKAREAARIRAEAERKADMELRAAPLDDDVKEFLTAVYRRKPFQRWFYLGDAPEFRALAGQDLSGSLRKRLMNLRSAWMHEKDYVFEALGIPSAQVDIDDRVVELKANPAAFDVVKLNELGVSTDTRLDLGPDGYSEACHAVGFDIISTTPTLNDRSMWVYKATDGSTWWLRNEREQKMP